MHAVSNELRRPLSHRRTSDVGTFVRYLLDFPDVHRGELGGLVRKAIRWHRAAGWQEIPPSGCRFDEQTPTKPPPIAIPDVPGLRFLSNVGDIRAEGERMHHCITLYAERAVAGHSYLFHVDYEGDCATVEVDLRGQVRQSCGPRNKPNRATEHGAWILRRWGSEFSAAAAGW